MLVNQAKSKKNEKIFTASWNRKNKKEKKKIKK
jgi:hypothetical protein